MHQNLTQESEQRWLLTDRLLVFERDFAQLTTMELVAEAEVLRLDNAWNEAYRRHNRPPLETILAMISPR